MFSLPLVNSLSYHTFDSLHLSRMFFMQAHIYSVVFESKGIGADSSKKTTLDKNRKKPPND